MSLRSSGLLVHVTSLPSPFGIGDLGPGAYRFVDYLAAAGQRLWQVLPLVPAGLGHSPYASPSTFAGNAHLVSPERLVVDGLLTEDDLAGLPELPADHVDYARAIPLKEALLARAFERFRRGEGRVEAAALARFRERHAAWLDDYALFMALTERHTAEGCHTWADWPRALARRDPDALDGARRTLEEAVERRRFWQFLFDRQWTALRAYARERGVRVLGDLPIYVAFDSADVWAHPDLFHLDAAGQPTEVAGVPPDFFSETGQRWGNPLYRWDRMEATGFRWWKDRLARQLELVDVVRLDHFRGFEAFWAIPSDEETAVEGRWVEAPGEALFEALERALGKPLPIVAEDLGIITPAVRALKARFDLPGMVVLPFGLEGGEEHLPHHYERAAVAYTGTHDNDTFAGWYASAKPAVRRFTRAYLGLEERDEAAHRAAVRAVLGSVADTAVIPLQDVLGLGSEARMNTPGSEAGNWAWRVTEDQLTAASAAWLRDLTEVYGRAETAAEEPEQASPASVMPPNPDPAR